MQHSLLTSPQNTTNAALLTSDERDPTRLKETMVAFEGMSPITISNVHFLEDERLVNPEPSRRVPRNPNLSSNAANIFRVKGTANSDRKDRIAYVRYENHSSVRNRKTTEQKIFEINTFVKKLTENLSQQEMPEISDTKFRALKKIIQYYDIKNLDRSQYTNVIKSFGLQIGSVRAEQKTPSCSEEKRNEVRKLRAMSLLNRTSKKFELKTRELGLEQTTNKTSLVPMRELSSEQGFKGEGPRTQALSLFNSLQVRKDKLKTTSPRKFRFTSGENCIIEKVNKYREFLFLLNYSNRVYRPLDLECYPVPLRFYIGRGNNGNLIRSLMRKRFYFEETHEKDAQFVWTQIKVPAIFARQTTVPDQPSSQMQKIGGHRSRSPPRSSVTKTESLQRLLSAEEVRQIAAIQELSKSRNLVGFEERLKVAPRRVRKEGIGAEDSVHNHLPGNGLLGNKKAMFLCLQQYCRLTGLEVFEIVPRTFIVGGLDDPALVAVSEAFRQKQKKKHNFWILKPGEFSNRGNGIQCTNKLEEIRKRAAKCGKAGRRQCSLIVQQYITRPLLYNGRKFDLRTYMLVTSHNAKTKAYWYQDGYVRTSSAFFSLQDSDPYIHLTNDAVQKHNDTYSYFEDGNKLSYNELQRYLDSLPANGRNLDIFNGLVPRMKEIAGVAVRSTWLGLNRENRDKNFELFGLDFMVDEEFRPWLIEVNTNPCLQLSSAVLQRLIPYLVENSLRIGLDTVFPPPDHFANNYKYSIPENSLHYNKFELIFDSDRDGPGLRMLYGEGSFFRELQGLQQDKNEFKQDGQIINVDEI